MLSNVDFEPNMKNNFGFANWIQFEIKTFFYIRECNFKTQKKSDIILFKSVY